MSGIKNWKHRAHTYRGHPDHHRIALPIIHSNIICQSVWGIQNTKYHMALHLWLKTAGVLEVRIDGFLGIEIVRLCHENKSVWANYRGQNI